MWHISTRNPIVARQNAAMVIALAVLLSGCSEIRLIGEYDEQIDKAATELQRTMDMHLTRIADDPASPEAAYDANRAFYLNYEVEVRSVQIRAQAQPKYGIIEQQFTLMLDSVQQLRIAHEAGPLAPETVMVLRDLFNQSWGAIIKLQRDLQRGQ